MPRVAINEGDVYPIHAKPPIPLVLPNTHSTSFELQRTAVTVEGVSRYEGVLMRGARVVAAIQDHVSGMTMDLTSDQLSQLTINVIDPGFEILGSGVFAGAPTLAYQGVNFILADVQTRSNGDIEALTIVARSYAADKLKRQRGPFVMNHPGTSAAGYVKAECSRANVPVIVQETLAVPQVSRDVAPYVQPTTLTAPDEIPSAWTTIKRLAQEYGYLCFESGGIVYFCSSSYLFERARICRVHYGELPRKATPLSTRQAQGVVADPATGKQTLETITARGTSDDVVIRTITVPECEYSRDSYETTVRVTLPIQAEGHVLPGYVMELTGVPYFSGLYLVKNVSYSLDAATLSVTAGTPIDLPPSNPGGLTAGLTVDASNAYDYGQTTSGRHGLPVCGITLDSFLAGMRYVESRNHYHDPPNSAGASGAYQYIDSTWRSYAAQLNPTIPDRYPSAYLAPSKLQDEVAYNEYRQKLHDYHGDWAKMAVSHYLPSYANSPDKWDYVPPGNAISLRDYAKLVLQHAGGNTACLEGSTARRNSRLASDFVAYAVSQAGKRYVRGADVSIRDPSPAAFDCAELVMWALGQVGIRFPRTSWEQWGRCAREQISVVDAIKTRGALLFIDDARHGPGGEHVAISLGNGTDMAAHSPSLGVGVRRTDASQWNRAALIPHLSYVNLPMHTAHHIGGA